MEDTTIALNIGSTAKELVAIAQAIRELKARERKFKRVMQQHVKLHRTIGTLVPKGDRGWI